MIESLSRMVLCRLLGWTIDVSVSIPEKSVICLAPHTSNWDFVIATLYRRAVGMKANYLMKREWFFWPLGPIFKRTGGIPVWRNKNTSMTEHLIKAARDNARFCVTITPEGTRSLNRNWKRGFYFIAKGAGIPILLFTMDYEKKVVGCNRIFWPGDDADADIKEIKDYYKDVKGRHPEKFGI